MGLEVADGNIASPGLIISEKRASDGTRFTFAARESSPKNGAKNTISTAATEKCIHGSGQ
jgi:hypothetical protein